jgi:hypothetical protein
MEKYGNKEGLQVNWQQTPIEFPPYVFTAWKVAETTANQRPIFKVQTLVEALI